MIVLKHVLVATDFSPASETALTYGRALARTFGASLHLLHVAGNFFLRPTPAIRMPSSPRRRERSTAAHRRGSRSVERQALVTVSDDAADAIAAYARMENIDVIVLGTHGRTGIDALRHRQRRRARRADGAMSGR